VRKDWFRFDPATWVAVTLAGLLPTGLLLVISSLLLTGMSISLSDLIEEPHRERVRAQARVLSAEIDRRLEELRSSLVATVAAAEGASGPLPAAASSVESLEWQPRREPGEAPAVVDDRAELADAVLRNLAHQADDGEREAVLRDLAALPPELEDELGFSYALEASLRLGAEVPDPLAVLRAPAIDRASLRAWLASGPGEGIALPGWPLPLIPGVRGAAGETLSLDPTDPTRFRLEVPTAGAGAIVATLATERFLAGALAAAQGAAAPPEGIFFALSAVPAEGGSTPAGAREPSASEETRAAAQGGRVFAAWPLPPPFDRTHELVTGTESAEPPVPLAMLRRLEGIQIIWGGLLLVGLALGTSLVLAALASRRVRVSMQKDNFLRLVSHELRTPISSIKIIAETLSLGRVRGEEERAQFLRQLEAESDRLADLVERVLEFGRGDAGARAREVVTDPEELVREAVRTFLDRERERREREGRGADGSGTIEIRSSQLFHPVLLDREAVAGVVQNLLSNARKYSPPGSPIEVTVGEASRELFISVRDQGPGIRRRDQKRIFRSFYRGENGAREPGFGLGLAYCRQVARAHRGRVSLESALGRGSTFTLAVPIDPARPVEGAIDG